MKPQSIAIDGRAIQSERVRELRLHQDCFANFEVFIFVPEPGTHGASEAFISAREKQRVFLATGFRCTICRAGENAAAQALRALGSSGTFCIIQRPLDPQRVLGGHALEGLCLDGGCPEQLEVSPVTDTVMRLVKPFICRRRTKSPLHTVKVGIIGSKGHFGKEICRALLVESVELHSVDFGEDASVIVDTHIVISAVGKPGVVVREQLGRHKDLLIDVGYTYDETEGRGFGDFHPSCYEASTFHTPVPGGVGPLQVLTLLERAVIRTGHVTCRPWSFQPQRIPPEMDTTTEPSK